MSGRRRPLGAVAAGAVWLAILVFGAASASAAIAPSGAAIGSSIATGTAIVLPAWAPAANELILVGVSQRDETKNGITVTGSCPVWTAIGTVDNVQGQGGVTLFRAQCPSPSPGSILVTIAGNTLPAAAVAQRFSGVDAATPIEAVATNAGPGVDDRNMLESVPTATAGAVAVAVGWHRGAVFSTPAGETALLANQTAGSGGDTTRATMWSEGPIASPSQIQLGAPGDLSTANDWSIVAVSLRAATTGPVAPTAGFTADSTDGTPPLAVGFTDTSTGSPTSWSWDFGDPGSPDNTSTLQNPSHVYTVPGVYTVTLTATNDQGSDGETKIGYVTVAAVIADFSADQTSGTAPLTVSFTDASLGSPSAWSWDFGDPGSPDNTSVLRNPSHTYSAPGLYTVTLTASNLDGFDTETKTGLVSVVALTAGFTADRSSGTAPLVVGFTDTSTGGPTTWSWDFGDPGSASNTSTERNPTHVYASPGQYTVTLTVSNGLTSDGETKTDLIVVSAPGDAVVVMAAGDIACDPASSSFHGGLGTSSACRQQYTSDLVVAGSPAAVLTLGDLQYEKAKLSDFQQSYDLSWGRFKSITYPAVGNHEYQTSGAAGYFDYFGARAGDRSKGYYSYDIGAWHVVVLNSNCSAVGGCKAGSPQEQWLRADLAANPAACTLAYWHHPRFVAAKTQGATEAFWKALYEHGAELVLNGHTHRYERFKPLTPAGVYDPATGIREIIVGTGGINIGGGTPGGNLEVVGRTFGVLELTLRSDGYDWEFLPEAGKTWTDSGSGSCH
ncbi:MAG: PKD domain-containing protein [Gaiellales bacterium]